MGNEYFFVTVDQNRNKRSYVIKCHWTKWLIEDMDCENISIVMIQPITEDQYKLLSKRF